MKKSSAYRDVDVDVTGFITGDHTTKVTVLPDAPVNPKPGDLWVDSDNDKPVEVGTYISSTSIGHASYDPDAPVNPTPGDIWVDPNAMSLRDSGKFIESVSINTASYNPDPPISPTPGDIWIDPNSNGAITSDTFIKSVSINTASYDPAPPDTPVPGDLWIDPHSDTDLESTVPLDISNNTTDITLGFGRIAYKDYIGKKEVNLGISVATEGIYEIKLFGFLSNPEDNFTNAFFKPNNTYYVGAFISKVNFTDFSLVDSFTLPGGVLLQCCLTLSTYKNSKTLDFRAISNISGAASYTQSMGCGIWLDNSIDWISLGTLVLPFEQSGRILIKRII
jgi:hypothetical protein